MNEVLLIGRLTRDPEIRYTQSQMAVCHFTLAIDRPVSRNNQGNGPTADFIRITVFDRQAENCNKYLTKGKQAAVQGRIQTGSYQDKDGKTVYTTDVIANRVEFLGSRNDGVQGNIQQQRATGTYGQTSYGGYNNQNSSGGRYDNRQNAPAGNNQNNVSYMGERNGNRNNNFGSGGDTDIPEGFSAIDEDDLPF